MNALRMRLQALWAGLRVWYAGHGARDRRIILGVLVFAGACVVYLYGYLPLRDYRQGVTDEITQGQEDLARAARVLGSADSLRAERESLKKKLVQARGRLLPGQGATLGAAALQERVNALAAEKGVTVQSTQVLKDEDRNPYRRVAVKLSMSGELKAVAEFFAGLEYGQQLAIPVAEINRRAVAAGAKGPRTLTASVEVAGFVLSEGAKEDEAKPDDAAPAAAEAAGEQGPGSAPTGPAGPPAATGTPDPPPGTRVPVPSTAPTGAPTGPGASTSTTVRPTTTTTSTRPVPTLPPLVPPRPPPAAAAPRKGV